MKLVLDHFLFSLHVTSSHLFFPPQPSMAIKICFHAFVLSSLNLLCISIFLYQFMVMQPILCVFLFKMQVLQIMAPL